MFDSTGRNWQRPIDSRFNLIGLVGILSTLTLNGCTPQPETITLSSGPEGSGYKNISKQIAISARSIGNLALKDRYDSQGSKQNLQRLLDKEVDFAIVQLDVASEAMKKGKVQTLLVLSEEYIHIVARADSQIFSVADLEGKRVGIGPKASGMYFTAKRLFNASNLDVEEVSYNIGEVLKKLTKGEIDAGIYVGPLATSKNWENHLTTTPKLRFIPVNPSLVNYLVVQFPESYRTATIPKGSYQALPQLPNKDVPTVSTPGALVTRPDVDKDKVALLTWSILSTFRQYSPFYSKLARENSRSLMHEKLIYIHPGAQQAIDNGDPRWAWVRYLQTNHPLQAALIMLATTTTIGFMRGWWRKHRFANLIENNRQVIKKLASVAKENPQQALDDIGVFRQQHRLMLIDGVISIEVYEQIERMAQVFAEQCSIMQEHQHYQSIGNIVGLIDQWQEILETHPDSVIDRLKEFEQKYQQMLLSGTIDIQEYIQMINLTVIMVTIFSSPQLSKQDTF